MTLLVQITRQRSERVAIVLIHGENLVERLERRAHIAGGVQPDGVGIEKSQVGRSERAGALQLRYGRDLAAEANQREAERVMQRGIPRHERQPAAKNLLGVS